MQARRQEVSCYCSAVTCSAQLSSVSSAPLVFMLLCSCHHDVTATYEPLFSQVLLNGRSYWSLLKLRMRWWNCSWTGHCAKIKSPLRTSAFATSMKSDTFNRRKEVTTLKSQTDLLPGLNTNVFQHLTQCSRNRLLFFNKKSDNRMQITSRRVVIDLSQSVVGGFIWAALETSLGLEGSGETLLTPQARA